MLRRIKRKAPLPPCNGSISSGGGGGGGGGGGSSGVGVVDGPGEHRPNAQPESVGSPTQNGKRTRKFGVISRSSFTRDSKDSRDFEHENGYGSTDTEATPSEPSTPMDTPTEEGRFIGPPGPPSFPMANHMAVGSTATLPARPRARLSDSYKTESLNSEPTCQVSYAIMSLTKFKLACLMGILTASCISLKGLEPPCQDYFQSCHFFDVFS